MTRLLLLVALVAALVTGCSVGDGEPRDWLRTVCGSDAEIATTPPSDRDYYADYRAEDLVTCTVPDRSPDAYHVVDAVAFRTGTDPTDRLLAAVDGYESGDGVDIRWATRETEPGRWAVVLAVAPSPEVMDGLDRLEDFDVRGSAEVFGRGDG